LPPELPVIQKTYDLIKWYVPILNRLPRDYKFTLGDRMINGLYDLLDGLIKAKYDKEKLIFLDPLNSQLDILRYQTRLLHEFELIQLQRYEFASQMIDSLGTDLGGWIRYSRGALTPRPPLPEVEGEKHHNKIALVPHAYGRLRQRPWGEGLGVRTSP
jgi:hypothetical protein